LREKVIEEYLRDEVKAIGGRAYKFVSPGNIGVPDRLIALPGGIVAFVELKAPGKKSTPIQEMQQKRLLQLGFYVKIVDSKAKVDKLIECFRKMIGA